MERQKRVELKSQKSFCQRYAMRKLKVKEEKHQHRFPRRFHNKTKNRVSVLSLHKEGWRGERVKYKASVFLCSGEFLRKEARRGLDGPRIAESKGRFDFLPGY